MKISKSKLRQIIREELKEGYSREEVNRMINAPRAGISAPPVPGGESSGEYDLEAENEKTRAKQTHDLTKSAPLYALLQAMALKLTFGAPPMRDAAIRKFAFDLLKNLEEEDFNDFVKAVEHFGPPESF